MIRTPPAIEGRLEKLTRPTASKALLKKKFRELLSDKNEMEIDNLINHTVLDTRLSPTVNLNHVFSIVSNNLYLKNKFQSNLIEIMSTILENAKSEGLGNSFYLHIDYKPRQNK